MLNVEKSFYFQPVKRTLLVTSVSFKSTGETIILDHIPKGFHNAKATTATWLNRGDINWSLFVDYIDKKFPPHKYPNPISIIFHASSDNSEGYTVLFEFLRRLGINGKFEDKLKELKRRFRFIAKDINAKIVERNKQGEMDLDPSDFAYLRDILRDMKTKFESLFVKKDNSYRVCDKLRNMFEFNTNNIVEDAETPFDSQNPSVVLFRNAWYHLDYLAQQGLAENLYKNLFPESLVLIGHCDENNAHKLTKAGFKTVVDPNCSLRTLPVLFEKP